METCFECNNCGKQFQYPGELNKHKKIYHPENIEALQCNNCGKTFATIYNKSYHEDTCSASMFKVVLSN